MFRRRWQILTQGGTGGRRWGDAAATAEGAAVARVAAVATAASALVNARM